jgi:acetaldehyde dehydrogenase (acetylating)
MPAFTLGCGTWGGSSVSENVSALHLINKKTLAYGIKDVSTLAAEDQQYQQYHGDNCRKSMNSGEELDISSQQLEQLIKAILKEAGKKE